MRLLKLVPDNTNIGFVRLRWLAFAFTLLLTIGSIGLLMARRQDDPEAQRQHAALVQGLADIGWVEGRTMRLETRWSVGDPAHALAAARELVELSPDILVANATPSLVALRQATTTLPIVFTSVADPVGQGFVPSLSRPGGNITGFSVEEASLLRSDGAAVRLSGESVLLFSCDVVFFCA